MYSVQCTETILYNNLCEKYIYSDAQYEAMQSFPDPYEFVLQGIRFVKEEKNFEQIFQRYKPMSVQCTVYRNHTV